MFEQSFKNIENILRKDAGCSTAIDYIEQTSWLLFLKYLENLEINRKDEAELSGKEYKTIINDEFKWSNWAFPKNKKGELDHHIAMTGDDLVDFVDRELFPYLKSFKNTADAPDTIEYKIGEIFGEIKNRIQSGYNLRDVIEQLDKLRFETQEEKHEMSHLYEDKIKMMGNAGKNGGEYYTPRPLIKTIVKVVAPKIGETIYDGAVGSAGFLAEAYDYLIDVVKTTEENEILQKKTLYGKEKKALAYVIANMNLILHGIDAPNIEHGNTLGQNIRDIQPSEQHDIVLANPPFGGSERAEVQQNFPIKVSETASLFIQHFIKKMKAGGRAGIVIKNTFMSNGADLEIRRKLLEDCNLHTVLDMPQGTFQGAGVKTVVLFFTKGEATKNIWYYQLNLKRNLGKTNPLNEKDLAEFIELQKTKAESENSWNVSIDDIDQKTLDLSPKNPNKNDEVILRKPAEIVAEMNELDKEAQKLLSELKEFI